MKCRYPSYSKLYKVVKDASNPQRQVVLALEKIRMFSNMNKTFMVARTASVCLKSQDERV